MGAENRRKNTREKLLIAHFAQEGRVVTIEQARAVIISLARELGMQEGLITANDLKDLMALETKKNKSVEGLVDWYADERD